MERALVTGGTGFAGQFLVQHLADGGTEVHATAHGSHGDAPGASGIHPLDLRDTDAVSALVSKLQPSEIYHLAGVTRPASDDIAGFYDVNLGGARNLLEAHRTEAPHAKLLLVGSAYAYAPNGEAIAESWPIAPRNHYGASKAATEMLGRAYAADGGHVILARPFNHSGPGQSPDFVLPTIVHQVAGALARGSDRVTLELGNLESVRDISDVRDVVRGYVVALRKGTPGSAYNLASGVGHTIRALVQLVAEAADVEANITQAAGRMRPDDIPSLVADISAAQRLGWTPTVPLRTTVENMLSALLEPVGR